MRCMRYPMYSAWCRPMQHQALSLREGLRLNRQYVLNATPVRSFPLLLLVTAPTFGVVIE